MKDGFKGSRTLVIPRLIMKELDIDKFSSMLYVTDIGHYPVAALHKRVRKTGISQYILIYCIDGEGWYELDGKRYDVKANHCFILPAYKPHKYGASEDNPWSIYWIHFKGEFASFYGEKFKTPFFIPPGRLSRIRDRLQIFEDIYTALSNGFSRSNIEFASSSLYYFLATIKYLDTFRASKQQNITDQELTDSAIHYMKENIDKSCFLQDICNYVGYSKSHFSSIFRKKIGTSPINYMIKLKMQYACELLEQTELKINQICCMVGIADQYYFSNLFTKNIGVSPSRYRVEYVNNNTL